MADDRRLTPQGEERKQQLLHCAAELFAERGYADTRVIDIVRAAGVAKGLFYWYFDNKEALFRELIATTRGNLRRAQGSALRPELDPLERLRQATEASVRFMADNAEIYALIRTEGISSGASSSLFKGSEVHVTDTATVIREGIEAGLVRDDDPSLLAYGVIGTVSYYTHLHRIGVVELATDELADFVADFVVRAVAVEPPVPGRSGLVAASTPAS